MNKIYETWLNSKYVSHQDKELLKSIDPIDYDRYFSDQKIEFGTAGARGVMQPGTQFINEQTITQITLGYIAYLKQLDQSKKIIVIGHDNRHNSKEFSLLVAKIISAHGIKAMLFGFNKLIPTPIVSYAIRSLKASGGIIITASHNPKQYNGFKVYKSDGGQLLPDATSKISSLMPSITEVLTKKTPKSIKNIRLLTPLIVKRYLRDARAAIINEQEFSKNPIVFTGHHGTSVKLLPKYLKKLGFNILPVKEQCFYDSDFKNSPNSNPEDFNSFSLAISLANKSNSNTIIGVDPDADRMCVVIKNNNQWRQISGNEMGIIFTHYILKTRSNLKKPYIISSYVSNTLIDQIANTFNAKVYRTGTGFKWMGEIITKIGDKEQFVVAFEEAIGALVLPINRDKDAFTASALCLEIIDYYARKKQTLVDVLELEIYPKYGAWYGQTDSFTIVDHNWKEIVEEKIQFLSQFSKGKILNYDIKSISWNSVASCLDWILSNNSWIRFRKSGTEPKFKIYYNFLGKDYQQLILDYKNIRNYLKELLKLN